MSSIHREAKKQLATRFIQFLWDNRNADLDSIGIWCFKLFLRRSADALGIEPLHDDYDLKTYMAFSQDEKAVYANWVEAQIEPFIKHTIGDGGRYGIETHIQGFVRTILRKIGRRPRTFN
jgi:hypothetical protein